MDPIAEGFIALLQPFVEGLTKLWELARDRKLRRNKDAAAYFEALASAMTRVLEGLRARQVPRIAGHEMVELIHGFPERTKRVLSATRSGELRSALAEAAEIAKTLDLAALLFQPALEADRERMLAQIERIIGDCKGLAAVLKPGA
jgi:hypothetical protein